MAYIPSFWQDDYCQIEIVPHENKAFIQKQAEQIENISERSGSEYGYTEIFVRGKMPAPTIEKELRVDYLERTLTKLQFQKAKQIHVEREIVDCDTGKIKAFGFSNFTIFFNTEEEFVNNIWLHVGLIDSKQQFELIESALYTLGEDCELVLIDWNSLELSDLRDKKQIQKYLMGFWKEA